MTNNNIKIICFDLDKTLIQENTWYNLNLALGVKPKEDKILFGKYANNRIDYQQWQKQLLKIYKQNGKANLKTIFQSLNNFTYKLGARKTIKYLKDKRYQIVLISGGIDILVKIVAEDLNIRLFSACNNFVFDEKMRLKDIKTCKNESLRKLEILKKFCKDLKIKTIQCVCVGDGDNDLNMFLATKHGITFTGSKLEKNAWIVIDNLTNLKEYL